VNYFKTYLNSIKKIKFTYNYVGQGHDLLVEALTYHVEKEIILQVFIKKKKNK